MKDTAKNPTLPLEEPKDAPMPQQGFDAYMKQLNKNQRTAVDTIEGPVLVVAGPGTGKTQVIALRTANILRRTHMNPGNILCLTYSNNGVKAMRERLRTIIGPDAYGITVNTIHSFCNDIIQKFPEIFIEFKALEQVSQIEQIRIIRRALRTLGAGSILGRPMGDKDRSADILSRINDMKRDGISPEDLLKIVPEYKEDIRTTDKGKQRATDTKSYQNDLRKVQQFEEFIQMYTAYNEALLESHRYDFNDMILMVLKALQEQDWLLASLQEQFMYILIDEFQDLNGAQNKVIELLTTYVHTDQPPNVFAVGDDDQAIFRFQGANIGNMYSFMQRFPDANVIGLEDNYRSTQSILNCATAVIEKNEQRLVHTIDELQKNLKAHTDAEDIVPLFVRYPDTNLEYAGMVQRLTIAHEKGTDWNNMAIICRKNDEVREIADVLFAAGIPSQITAKQDMMNHPQVRQVLSLLQSIVSIDSSHLLADALALRCFAIPAQDLGKLFIDFRSHNRAQQDQQAVQSLHEYILTNRVEVSSEILTAYDLILDAHTRKGSTVVPELVQHLLIASHVLPTNDDSVDPRIIAGLHSFYDYVKNRCYEQKSLTLEGLLDDLQQYIVEPSLKLEYDMPHLVTDGVQLMTAHAAKGLEYDIVIVPNVWYGNWGNRSGGTSLSLPDHLLYDINKNDEKRANQEDERRLFYVAITRAKNELCITFPETYRSAEQMKNAQVSSFIADAENTVTEIVLPVADIPEPIEILKVEPISISHAFEAYIRSRLEHFDLSVTALNSFIDDPVVFLWEQLLQKPRAKAAHLAYGTAVHSALESRNLSWKHGHECKDEDLLVAFTKYLQGRELMTQTEREHYMHMGEAVLARYIESTSGQIPIVAFAERTLRARLTNISTHDDTGVPIKGKVDRIDLFQPHGQKCRVIDFKTGTPKKTEAAVYKDENLYRQLVFYKILCNSDPSFHLEADTFTLDFVGNDIEERRVIDLKITQQEVEDLLKVIEKVWSKIQNLDFTPLE